MPFIGVQPATVPLTANDITDGIISTAKIVDDAVDNTKLDLADNYAFTGTVSGAGKILQIQTGTKSGSNATDSSGSFIDSGLSVTITPSSSSNKVLLIASCTSQNDAVGGGTYMRFLRGSTTIFTPHSGGIVEYCNANNLSTSGLNYLDSPSTTSATTYKVQFCRYNTGNSTFFINNTIQALEVLA